MATEQEIERINFAIETIEMIKAHFVELDPTGSFSVPEIVSIFNEFAENLNAQAKPNELGLHNLVWHDLTVEMMSAIKQAKKLYGEYTYEDKGPREVMNVGYYAEKVRSLPLEEAGLVINQLGSSGRDGALLACSILGDLEDWDELFEIDGVEDYYL